MKKLSAAIGILFLAVTVSAQTTEDPWEGGDSVQLSTHLGDSSMKDVFWDGYISGVVAAGKRECNLLQADMYTPTSLPLYRRQEMANYFSNVPANTVTYLEEEKAVQKYIADHPTTLHKSAVGTIDDALRASYPCRVTQ